jgi:uncharacterized membrane protein (UPF0127 family)
MKKSYLIIVIAILVIFVWLTIKPNHSEKKYNETQIEIANHLINLEIADTNTKRELGLSGHKPLADDQGMLFVFNNIGKYPFWMKDMLFPIDIIWLEPSNIEGVLNVVYIEKNAQPNSYPATFGGQIDAQYVLEVNAGFSDKNNLKIGDQVKFYTK